MSNIIDIKKELEKLKSLKVNPDNEKYYSEQFVKGFNLGAERQLRLIKEKIHE